MTLPPISIILLNYNSLAHLRPNLESLTALDYPTDRVEILLVDNGSTDSSVEWVADHYPTVRIVRNQANLGFARGNNAGVQAASHNWAVILNPDTRVPANWLRELVRPLASYPQTAAVASKMLTWDGQMIDFADAAMNFMGWGCQPGFGSTELAAFNQEKEILFACGGAMLLRRDLFLEMGGFDPDYFAYYEDVDLGWRLWLHGHRLRLSPQAAVYHRHHGSWADVASARSWLLAERNTLFTIIKNYEADNLARILPGTLLLAWQRTFLDVNADPAAVGVPPGPAGAIFGPRYYLWQAGHLLRQGQFKALGQRAWAEGLRRRQRERGKGEGVTRPYNQPVNGQYHIPAVALSRLLAGREVLNAWPELEKKRAWVQHGRKRSDQEIFPLFQWALTSNFGDERFIHAMNQISNRFGLDKLFAEQAEPLTSETRAVSQSVSLALLQRMSALFEASGAPENSFRIDGKEQPAAYYPVPESWVRQLAGTNRLLWQIPPAPLAHLLPWLENGIHEQS